MASIWGELVRRSVVKVAVAYAVIAWTLIQVSEIVFPRLGLPDWSVTLVLVLLLVFAPVALFLAWAYDLTPNGIQPDAGPSMPRRHLVTGAASLGLLGLGGVLGALLHRRLQGPTRSPSFQRLTFRRGMIRTARFTPDFQSVLYGALWDGDDCRVYTVHPPNVESAPLQFPQAAPLAVSAAGDLALTLGRHIRGVMTYGTLARVPLAGGVPRELVENVKYADWSPDGAELAIVRRDGGRDLLEYPIGRVLAESRPVSETGLGGFSFPRVSADGETVAFFELVGGLAGRVAVVDRQGVKTTLTPEFKNVHGLAWKGDEIWFTAAEERWLLRDVLLAVTPGGEVRTVTRMIGNISLHDVAPDGRALVAITDDRSGVSVLARGASGERDLSWLDGPSLADLSADGQFILFSEWGAGGGEKGSVYLRRTDGSPAIRIGDGAALALSPDAQWALLLAPQPSRIELVSTRAGEPRVFEREGWNFGGARWLPDGKRAVVAATEPGRDWRLYLLDLETGDLQTLSPEGAANQWAVSPDGLQVAAASRGRIRFYPIAGGAPTDGPELTGQESLRGWLDSGLLVSDEATAMELGRLSVLDIESGQRTFWRDIKPLDPAGLMYHGFDLTVAPDGQSYAYQWHRALSDLYLIDGLDHG